MYEKQHSDCVFNLFPHRTEEEKKDWIQVSMTCHSFVSMEICLYVLLSVLLIIFICMAHAVPPVCLSQAIQATIQRHEQSVETFRMLNCSVREEDWTPPNSPVRVILSVFVLTTSVYVDFS